jgi:TctA family transporter
MSFEMPPNSTEKVPFAEIFGQHYSPFSSILEILEHQKTHGEVTEEESAALQDLLENKRDSVRIYSESRKEYLYGTVLGILPGGLVVLGYSDKSNKKVPIADLLKWQEA